MKTDLVIIGAGMATAYLLQELAAADHDLTITVFGEEREACYNRVLLSGLLSGENREEDLAMLEGNESAQLLTGTPIEHIDLRRRRVVPVGGGPVAFQRLVLATGARVAQPALDCAGLSGVEVLRTLDDVRRLRSRSGAGRHALVVGAGLLGLEAAYGLTSLGYRTTVLHRNGWPMNRQLDREGGAWLQRKLQARGIVFRFDTTLAGVDARGSVVTGVQLADGSALGCDLLLFATGIRPNMELARAGGIEVERGVLVDGHLCTSHPGVYALGECSQFEGHCFGLVAPIREQARVLARTLLNRPGGGFRMADWPTQLKISGTEIFRAGRLDDGAEQLVLRDEAGGIYRRLVVKDDRLIGAVLVGDQRGGNWYADLISSGASVAGLRAGLMFGREVAEALQPVAAAA